MSGIDTPEGRRIIRTEHEFAAYNSALIDIVRIYEGSNGDATKALFDRLARLGPAGQIALNLFRACKNSARAKVYRGGGSRVRAYDRKQWAMENLVTIMTQHAVACGPMRWGWGQDEKQGFHKWVLYIDLPSGQVSFHTQSRGAGPDYPDKWDGVVDASAGRVCTWCANLLAQGGGSSG